MSKPYTQRPAGPPHPKPKPVVKSVPEFHWPGEEKFRTWRFPGLPEPHLRERGVVREYYVYGLLNWQSGPRASQLNLSRVWTLRLLLNDNVLTVEAEVAIFSRNAKKLPRVAEPERGVVVTIPISTPAEDAEVRKLKRYMLRLAPWTGERLGPAFEAFLEGQGL
ncbi:hypothetical protein HGK82_00730 [Ochrobactrum sp. MT180101]|nr:hypothetical protein HGK82_00730 [Ochrobactrum sp. MT180101]